MAFIEVGTRQDLEKGIRTLFLLPAVIVCPLVAGSLLKDHMPTLMGFVLGGAVGGGIAYLLAEMIIKLLNSVWPSQANYESGTDIPDGEK